MKTLFFDISNVLIFYDQEDMYDKMVRDSNVSKKNIAAYKKLFYDLSSKYQKGQISTNHLYDTLQEEFNSPINFPALLNSTCAIFYPNNAILPILQALRLIGINLVILSNTCEIHYNYLTSTFPHFSYFNSAILSYEVRCCKPDVAIYKKALQNTSSKLEDCYYVDDSYANIKAARKLGLNGYCFENVEQLKKKLIKRGFLFEGCDNIEKR